MCGVNFILSKKPIPETALTAMQQSNRYRGPDNSGDFYYYRGDEWHLALGANRLMVVDRDSESNQPMLSECGNYLLAYNGEVYNYQDLKNSLLREGVTFRSHSDTEVVLNWIQKFGAAGLNQLKGMFALVFVDLQGSAVIVARDISGIKPLYVYQDAEKILVSSTVRAIQDSGLATLTLNNTAVNEYLSFRHVMGNKSFFNEVEAVEPGQILEIDKRQILKKTKIEVFEAPDRRDLQGALIEALALQYSGVAMPGLMLSGGVDSTLMLAMLSRELDFTGMPTFTLNTSADATWAAKAAKQYQAQHYLIEPETKSTALVQNFLAFTDQPVADHGALATWLVAKEVKEQHRVLLSGAGADELFGGYNRHRAYYLYLRYSGILQKSKTVFQSTRLHRLLPKGIKMMLDAIHRDYSITFENFLKIYAVNNYSTDKLLRPEYNNPEKQFFQAITFDRLNYLVNDVLTITDNAGMQQGVEVRVPFLYDNVVQAASGFTAVELMQKKGKAPLKDLLRIYDGAIYTNRPKMGFGLPMDKLLRQEEWRGLWAFLEYDHPIYAFIPKHKIKNMLEEHLQMQKDNNMQLWSILVLENWLSRN